MGTQLETTSVGNNPPKFSRYRSVRRAAETQKWTGEGSSASNAKPPPTGTIARSMSRYHRPKTPTAATNPPTPAVNQSHPPVPALPPALQASQPAQPKQQMSDEEDDMSEIEKARIREETMRQLTLAERPKTSSRAPNHQSQSKPVPEHKQASWRDKLGLPHHKKTGPLQSDSSEDSESNQNNMDAGARHLAPGPDAPVSAVNAGERRVLVKCKSSAIKLPVTPTTRAKDLIYSAVNCFSTHADPTTAIIVESFASLGLDRPLRRYEHVRDVMNSWSADHVNALVISDAPYAGATEKLELRAAPNAQPKDAKFYLYHSSKPGKWDKRYVTLRADGQVALAKKSDAKEKDYTNICHMSDFDIYTPTGRQLSKTIKPPKKICFAIKSQQKSSMFISTENFVHFFTTNDSSLAQNFYDAVHGWRSWYLVHVLGVGQKQAEPANANISNAPAKEASSATIHQRHVSTDSVPYQLGSFKPLVEFGRNSEPGLASSEQTGGGENNNTSSRDMFLRKKKARDHAPPPSAFPVNLPALDTKNESLSPHDDDSPFSPDSLLGRTYSQRQAAQREREAKDADENGPFMPNGLLQTLSPTSPDQLSQNSRQNSRSNTIRSHHHPLEGGASHSRSNSVRQKTKPLVDLTPTYREAPQHVRKGQGVKVGAGVPLVEGATGPDPVPGMPAIPPATTWRREEAARPTTAANETSSSSIATRRRANTVKSQHRHHHHHQNGYASPSDAANPFMPNGLAALASINNSANAQGNVNMSTGRGVATGDRNATRPLLDMTPQSQFVEGSLLRNMERNH